MGNAAITVNYPSHLLEHRVKPLSGEIEIDSTDKIRLAIPSDHNDDSRSNGVNNSSDPPRRQKSCYQIYNNMNKTAVICMIRFFQAEQEPRYSWVFEVQCHPEDEMNEISKQSRLHLQKFYGLHNGRKVAVVADSEQAALQQLVLRYQLPSSFTTSSTTTTTTAAQTSSSNTDITHSRELERCFRFSHNILVDATHSKKYSELFCYLGTSGEKSAIINWRKNDLGLKATSRWANALETKKKRKNCDDEMDVVRSETLSKRRGIELEVDITFATPNNKRRKLSTGCSASLADADEASSICTDVSHATV